jgi:hypothetical protein
MAQMFKLLLLLAVAVVELVFGPQVVVVQVGFYQMPPFQ